MWTILDLINFQKNCKNCERELWHKGSFSCMDCGYLDWRKALINGITHGICFSAWLLFYHIIISTLVPDFISFFINKYITYLYLLAILFLPSLYIQIGPPFLSANAYIVIKINNLIKFKYHLYPESTQFKSINLICVFVRILIDSKL